MSMTATLRQGDFSALAEDYAKHRPDYSTTVLRALMAYVGAEGTPGFQVADVGAGTGLWTRMLAGEGLEVRAVEPCDPMREQGRIYTRGLPVEWSRGSGEATGLASGSADWITMASSFHWVRQPDGMAEFHRVLRPRGYLTVLWNPRDIDASPLHREIESRLHELVPGLRRVSSGHEKNARDWSTELLGSGHFEDVVFFEARHQIAMSHERYIGAWRSVNDIQAQAGPERFEAFLEAVAEVIAPLPEVIVPYKTRAWTARRVDV
ncbi:MAG TPA: SAM-dependent methyltransferase [Verrucomicrobiales bacterium]|nr:SAM-dependent methyltransferase [Verrucomicrobiales bacterium]